MKLSVKPENIKYLVLGAGGLGLVLRLALYGTGIDEKGLLISGHWAGIALWVLSALVAAALLFLTRSIRGPEEYCDACPESFTAGLGALVLAAGILLTTISGFAESSSSVEQTVWLLGVASVISMAWVSFCRFSGKKPPFLCYGAVCLYFALRMVSRYQFWSSDPQLQDYVFYLGAYVALMLTAYHHAAFAAGIGRHRSLWLLSLAAVYLCCLSLKGTSDTLLLFTAGIWAFTNLTGVQPKSRRQRPALHLEEE